MTQEQFWELIEQAKGSTQSARDIPGWLVEKLGSLTEREIIDYNSRFEDCMDEAADAKLWLAAVVIMGGCGDDAFSDFRAWLIAQGRSAFEAALLEPDSLAELEKFDGEDGYPRLERMLYVDKKAFFRCAGRDDFETESRYEALLPKRGYPPLKNSELVNSSYEEAKERFPKLAARFPEGIRGLKTCGN